MMLRNFSKLESEGGAPGLAGCKNRVKHQCRKLLVGQTSASARSIGVSLIPMVSVSSRG